ncbi:sigma-70 family RNA polymerase sigma factor [Kibdelosporangium phytohabitans]|uniref:RNA polymerase subunit sigma-70 n=1 Tax=Kibdelosporangium phytohabitans TaxID=860235 RepID=A0A0N9I887_9PSEU|nr:sigma-70 family RNA polymerase sigma factor [Kibdelosporangium phytohabitans]ALG12426.1 RNA polymerase subunit sigma-70 [Kibdelosporangium phytohabitans]MBE1464013.1 RNA polymerase sigma-70 factor (ECF subfamily) [Kibdelosporangium phytohabitans]
MDAELFEQDRTRLRAVAYRILGSTAEADDAVQEAWLRANQAGTDDVENLSGWLTTVVARVCLNMLRSRAQRREEPFEIDVVARDSPEQDAELADSVGLAMLVVLDTLSPVERLAFVLHDMFAMPFDDIAPLIEKSAAATRQLASRARRRVRGAELTPDLARQRAAADAYLAATRGGDFEALMALLAPDVVLRADAMALPTGKPVVIRGADVVAKGAMASAGRALLAEVALVNGSAGLVMGVGGRLAVVLAFTFADGVITGIDVIGDRDRLRATDLSVLSQTSEV